MTSQSLLLPITMPTSIMEAGSIKEGKNAILPDSARACRADLQPVPAPAPQKKAADGRF
jgi:hypothetical protein